MLKGRTQGLFTHSNCPKCGRITCNECLSEKIELAEQLTRVCDPCADAARGDSLAKIQRLRGQDSALSSPVESAVQRLVSRVVGELSHLASSNADEIDADASYSVSAAPSLSASVSMSRSGMSFGSADAR